jgi:hypothetical protein
MSIESDLRAYVLANSAVAAIVGTKMYGIFAPDNVEVPFITYRRLPSGAGQQQVHAGATTPTKSIFRLVCWASTYENAIALADKVRACLNGQKGTWTNSTVRHCWMQGDESDVFQESPELTQREYFGRQLDFEISYNA